MGGGGADAILNWKLSLLSSTHSPFLYFEVARATLRQKPREVVS